MKAIEKLSQITNEDFDRYFTGSVIQVNGKLVYYRGDNHYSHLLQHTLRPDTRLDASYLPRSRITSWATPRIGYYKGCGGRYASVVPLRTVHKGLSVNNVLLKHMDRFGFADVQREPIFDTPNGMSYTEAIKKVLDGQLYVGILNVDTAVVLSIGSRPAKLLHKGSVVASIDDEGRVITDKNVAMLKELVPDANFCTK